MGRGDSTTRLRRLHGGTIRAAIDYVDDMLHLIDTELVTRGSEPIGGLVEIANLSSMVGNLLGAGIAEQRWTV